MSNTIEALQQIEETARSIREKMEAADADNQTRLGTQAILNAERQLANTARLLANIDEALNKFVTLNADDARRKPRGKVGPKENKEAT